VTDDEYDELRERVRQSVARHWRVLNRLDPHLGCVRCGGLLSDGDCRQCESLEWP
jgi:hypothetical protein